MQVERNTKTQKSNEYNKNTHFSCIKCKLFAALHTLGTCIVCMGMTALNVISILITKNVISIMSSTANIIIMTL